MVRRNNYNGDKFAKEFGIQVGAELAQVDARILPPPVVITLYVIIVRATRFSLMHLV